MVDECKQKMNLGTLLKELRESKGLSGAAAARGIGFSAAMLSKIELGHSLPANERLDAIASFYDVSVLELQAQAAIDRGRIEVPPGVPPAKVRAALYELVAEAEPGRRPEDPHGFHCPECGVGLTCSRSKL